MISMARIQGSSMGYDGFQKPIVQMGQDSFANGPIGTGVVPSGSQVNPAALVPQQQVFQQPVFPNVYPNYNFPVITDPATPAPIPTWVIVGGALAAGAVVAALVMNNKRSR
jgi:hypothetical protein